MAGFLGLVDAKKSWDDLNGRTHGVINGNRVLAQTTNVCETNGGSTYVGLVSYVVHGRAPTTAEEAADFATSIKPLLDCDGPLRQHGGKYKAALRQEVQERSTSTSEGEMSADLAPVQARAKRGVNSEVFHSYIENAEPITVIGIIIDVLDQAGDIVHVDLRKQTVTSSRALARALDTDDDKQPTAVRLRGLETFVSIRGLFRATDRTPEVTTFEAPYGEPPDLTAPADGPQIHLTCRRPACAAPPSPPARSRPAALAASRSGIPTNAG
jgi:hypothetical protein